MPHQLNIASGVKIVRWCPVLIHLVVLDIISS